MASLRPVSEHKLSESTFTPLIFSVIFYLSNGRNKISYVDSLFNCISAMAVCGLATVDLSSLTPFQQFLLFVQMCIGNPVRFVLAQPEIGPVEIITARKDHRLLADRLFAQVSLQPLEHFLWLNLDIHRKALHRQTLLSSIHYFPSGARRNSTEGSHNMEQACPDFATRAISKSRRRLFR